MQSSPLHFGRLTLCHKPGAWGRRIDLCWPPIGRRCREDSGEMRAEPAMTLFFLGTAHRSLNAVFPIFRHRIQKRIRVSNEDFGKDRLDDTGGWLLLSQIDSDLPTVAPMAPAGGVVESVRFHIDDHPPAFHSQGPIGRDFDLLN